VFFHTDSDMINLIPNFIKIGVDILNPIQTSVGKMANPEELKTNYVKIPVALRGDGRRCGGIWVLLTRLIRVKLE